MTPSRRILALSPMPPEPLAYGMARYSRSPDGIEDSLRWIASHENSSAEFLKSFYFQYGHSSIADSSSIVTVIEGLSELAALTAQDEPLWNGQAKSTRYQRLSKDLCYRPSQLDSMPAARDLYETVLTQLFSAYDALHPRIAAYLSAQHPRPNSMSEAAYLRAVNARAFDCVRYFLPLATLTNIGQLLTIRTLEKQISRMGGHPLPEIREIAATLAERCAEPPRSIWNELTGQPIHAEPLAPTLARHCAPNTYPYRSAEDLSAYARETFKEVTPDTSVMVDLVPVHNPLRELVTTLLYPVTTLSYRQILTYVLDWPEQTCQEVIEIATRHRGPYHELLNEFQIGQGFTFDVLMDIGGWRDLHRHRRWFQTRQAFSLAYGFATPPLMEDVGVLHEYQRCMDMIGQQHYPNFQAELTAAKAPDLSTYLIPFGARCRSLYKGSLSQFDYVIRLRSGVKGHLSYRRVAYGMYECLVKAHPFMASLLSVTHPDVEDPLVR